MKTSFISSIFMALAVIAQASHGLAQLEPDESTSGLDPRTPATSQTCGNMADLVPLYEIYSTRFIFHFYSILTFNVTNFITIDTSVFDGVTGLIFPTAEVSTVPFYCLRGPSYFFTANETERTMALANGYADYMTTGYIYPSQICGSVPLYRLHLTTAAHVQDCFYTTSVAEKEDAILNQGFVDEGVAGYIFELLSDVNP
ncbi:hypothetical protein K438DRAFT_1827168 [Mycena galopus ATCC 62051]|nr:hypothetical protein K438DRAFT_1827168 [Mycena galopus ATCC 62051]